MKYFVFFFLALCFVCSAQGAQYACTSHYSSKRFTVAVEDAAMSLSVSIPDEEGELREQVQISGMATVKREFGNSGLKRPAQVYYLFAGESYELQEFAEGSAILNISGRDKTRFDCVKR